ncbi:class II aldolase/adducin family protein [Paenibacillus thalictri]|uniref:Class II aldolase/adducin family protein n=1 Tax=Paenibacillus thalictri TaxID=2527873 RepID=A0A4V2J3M3_9BACL|nr:class II aldolase/adducin family protein [Paenibacillus thalictri]TBL73337.1 class II aldolase/adducin family protein [Paenibacillus thalictri]
MSGADMLSSTIEKLVLANQILSNEGILDAFGHVSARNPDNPEQFLLSRAVAPSLVTEDGVMLHDFDGDVLDKAYAPYAERILHARIYKARPDVQAICHNHAAPLLPFTVTGVELKPIMHMAGMFYDGIPVYDEGEAASGMLIVSASEADRVARALGGKRGLLMRGHGAVVVGSTVEEVVMSSVYLAANAEVQYRAMQMGTPKFISPEEGQAAMEKNFRPIALGRAWSYWVDRVKSKG